MDEYDTNNRTEALALCRAHLAALRANPCFRDAKICLIPEANLANEAQNVADDLVETPGISVLCEYKDRWGVWTRSGAKALYVFRLTEKLAEDAVAYHGKDYVLTGNPFIRGKTRAQIGQKTRNELEKQLRSFRRVVIAPKNIGSDVKILFSGKVDKDNNRTSRLRDDLCLALLLGVYWSGQARDGLIQERGFSGRFYAPRNHIPTPVSASDYDAAAADADEETQMTGALHAKKRRGQGLFDNMNHPLGRFAFSQSSSSGGGGKRRKP